MPVIFLYHNWLWNGCTFVWYLLCISIVSLYPWCTSVSYLNGVWSVGMRYYELHVSHTLPVQTRTILIQTVSWQWWSFYCISTQCPVIDSHRLLHHLNHYMGKLLRTPFNGTKWNSDTFSCTWKMYQTFDHIRIKNTSSIFTIALHWISI